MKTEKIYALWERDGTSPTSYPILRGIALHERDAKDWVAKGNPDWPSLDYPQRSYSEAKIFKGE